MRRWLLVLLREPVMANRVPDRAGGQLEDACPLGTRSALRGRDNHRDLGSLRQFRMAGMVRLLHLFEHVRALLLHSGRCLPGRPHAASSGTEGMGGALAGGLRHGSRSGDHVIHGLSHLAVSATEVSPSPQPHLLRLTPRPRCKARSSILCDSPWYPRYSGPRRNRSS